MFQVSASMASSTISLQQIISIKYIEQKSKVKEQFISEFSVCLVEPCLLAILISEFLFVYFFICTALFKSIKKCLLQLLLG